MITCPVCRIAYVENTLFCSECGLYLLKSEEMGTDPLEAAQVQWLGDNDGSPPRDQGELNSGPRAVRLHISYGDQERELEVPMTKPIRLGRMDPLQDIYPEVDLTESLAMEYGVSREHARIFRRGDIIVVEDLGSTNGTLLNGERLAPFLPQILEDGDQLQLGKLLIDVYFSTHYRQKTPVK